MRVPVAIAVLLSATPLPASAQAPVDELPMPPLPESPALPTSEGAASEPSADAIARRMKQQVPGFRVCIERATKLRPDLPVERVVLLATIAPTGRVRVAVTEPSTLAADALGTCLRDASERIRFPPFEGEPIEVEIPLRLSTSARR